MAFHIQPKFSSSDLIQQKYYRQKLPVSLRSILTSKLILSLFWADPSHSFLGL